MDAAEYEAAWIARAPQVTAARAKAILIDCQNQGSTSVAAAERLNDYVHALADRACDLEAKLRDVTARLDAVRACKVWTDDLRRDYVFCDELWHATDPEFNPEPKPIRLDGDET